MFKSWEELTDLERAQCTYSDMHKDAYGFRPRHHTVNWTLDDFQREFESLQRVIDANFINEQAQEKQAIDSFENLVTKTITSGAHDRETALRWIMDGSDAGGNWEYFCYLNGLPYGYFKQAA